MVAFLPLCLFSQTRNLIIGHADGATTEVNLYTLPSISFKADSVIVSSSDNVLKWAAKDVVRLTYEKASLGIEKPEENQSPIWFQDRLIFRGTSKGVFQVFNLKGIQIPVTVIRNGEDLILSLSSLAQGTYIVSFNGKTFKIQKP